MRALEICVAELRRHGIGSRHGGATPTVTRRNAGCPRMAAFAPLLRSWPMRRADQRRETSGSPPSLPAGLSAAPLWRSGRFSRRSPRHSESIAGWRSRRSGWHTPPHRRPTATSVADPRAARRAADRRRCRRPEFFHPPVSSWRFAAHRSAPRFGDRKFMAPASGGGTDAAMGIHVFDLFGALGRQVPDLLVVVAVHVFRCPAGPPAGGLDHLLAHAHHAFFIAQTRQCIHYVVVADPVIGLQAQSLDRKAAHRSFPGLGSLERSRVVGQRARSSRLRILRVCL